MGIKGKQIEDDTLTGDDIDESTLVITLQDVCDNGSSTTVDLGTANILPSVNNSFNLGSSSFLWKDVYFSTAHIKNQMIVSSNDNSELIRLQKGDTQSRYLVFESEGVDKFEMYLNEFENFIFTTTDTTDDIVFRLNGHSAIYLDGYPKEVRIWDVYNSAYNTQINSTLEVEGEISTKKIIAKKVIGLSSASGTTTHDCSQGTVFIHDSISGTFSADLINLNIPALHSCEIKLFLEQGSTAYMCDGIKINGSGKTIKWEGGSAPSGTSNGTDEITFNILYNGTDYLIFGSAKNF